METKQAAEKLREIAGLISPPFTQYTALYPDDADALRAGADALELLAWISTNSNVRLIRWGRSCEVSTGAPYMHEVQIDGVRVAYEPELLDALRAARKATGV